MINGKAADRFLSDLNKAIALHQQNRLPEAEAIYRQLLRQQPGHFDAVHLLGTLLRRTGKLEESQALLDRAVTMRPQSWAAHFNRGNTLLEQRAFAAAADSFSRTIALKTDHAEAHYGRAVARLELGEAETACTDAQTALKLKPGYPEAALTLAMGFASTGRHEDAKQIILRLLAARPAWPEALEQLARILHQERNWAQEVEVLNRALSLAPKRSGVLMPLAEARRAMGQTQAALQVVEQALVLDPRLAAAHGLRGEILGELGDVDEALTSLDQAISLDPASAQAHTGRGHALGELGRTKEAAAAYERALEIAPAHAPAYYGLSLIHRFAVGDPRIARMREISSSAKLGTEERSELFFALAKALEDTGDAPESFTFLKQANALRRQILDYRPEEDAALFRQLAAAAPALTALAGSVEADPAMPVPVFIVGMPRSGTTLIEQILSAGPDVKGAGELNFVKLHGLGLATGAEPATPAALSAFAQRYLASIAPLSGGKAFVADKMPHNFRFLPLICAALPQARILHVTRDARAVCWSNYKQYFSARSLGYAYDLGDVVNHYLHYEDLMQRWMALCGARIMNISYEHLTADQEGGTRRMIGRLALPWHDAYLAPESNARVVRTASAQQVRQPVYRGSSEAWRTFAPFIGDAFDRLPKAPPDQG